MAFLVSNENEERFAIPNGETVIGRGPYLRVKEATLSRSHAVIALTDGHVSIKPTHRNPTYFYATGSEENGVVLEQDKWKDLVSGNHISLLSNSYKYCIEIACPNSSNVNELNGDSGHINECSGEKADNQDINSSGEKRDDQDMNYSGEKGDDQDMNSSGEKRDNQDMNSSGGKADNQDINSSVEKRDNKRINSSSTEERCLISEEVDLESMLDEALAQELPKNKDKTSSFHEPPITGTPSPRKRKLPSWMSGNGSATKKKNTSAEPKSKKIKVAGPKFKCKPLLHDESTEKTLEDLPSKKSPVKEVSCIETSPEHKTCYASKLNKPGGSATTDPHASDLVDDEEHTQDDEEPGRKSSIQEINQDELSNDSVLDSQDDRNAKRKAEAEVLSGNQSKSSDEPKPCPYGKRCYRRNPVHFVEFTHDNVDDDTKQENDGSEGSNDDGSGGKPECPYGLKCYRQGNPHHTSRFTHTSIGRQRRARKTRKQHTKKKSLLDKESDNEGENEYDLNDSFLVSSSDSGGYSDDSDDSDYKPYGNDDDDESEDVNELLAEAKGFLKNKKM